VGAQGNPDEFLAQAGPSYPQTEIGPSGGEVVLTDPNGVTYTLAFPVDAVHEPTGITLVPIESVNGLPFAGGLLAGVQIHPPIPVAGPARQPSKTRRSSSRSTRDKRRPAARCHRPRVLLLRDQARGRGLAGERVGSPEAYRTRARTHGEASLPAEASGTGASGSKV
jgi:hypothetical protein